MATKKTESTKKAAPATKAKPAAKGKGHAKPAAKPAKAAPVAAGPRHPRARVVAAHGSKAELAKALAQAVARADQDVAAVEAQLKTASNAQLLRLSRATKVLKEKFGNRDKLIAAIGTAKNKSKDKDYLAKLATYSLPQLLDLAAGAQRHAG